MHQYSASTRPIYSQDRLVFSKAHKYQQNAFNNKMIKNSSIKVAVKIKPSSNPKKIIVSCPQASNVPYQPPYYLHIKMGEEESKKIQTDAVHDANCSKQTIFKDLRINSLVQKFMAGFNVTIMAYGQTGAGKTYAMEGNQSESGIIAESIQMIYDEVKQLKIQNSQDGVQGPSDHLQVSCSYIQLYNEKIYDLLADDSSKQSYLVPGSDHLKLRWEADRDFIVEDLSWHYSDSSQKMQKLWRKGNKNRAVASNKIHDFSSRSHGLFTITVTDYDEQNNFRQRQLTFVDLAGSERLFDHIGRLSKESIEINKSLFVLRKVIKILQEKSSKDKNSNEVFVPFRDSKLTSLLKKALGGNCLTMMIACIQSTLEHRDETLSTLSYAISAGKIQNTAKINIDQQVFENKSLKKENEKLRKELEVAWKQIDLMHKKDKAEAQRKSMTEYSHKIIQCIGTIRELIKSNKELREELDEERKIKRQQKLEIEMLMEEKYMSRKFSQTNKWNQKEQKEHSSKKSDYKPEYSNSFEQISPKKGVRISQLMTNGAKQSVSPTKSTRVKQYQQNSSKSKGRQSSIIKRKKYFLYKTEPDGL